MSRGAVALLALGCLLVMFAAPASAQYGRTQGGFGGAALGAMGGSAAGTALVAAAGIANPLLSGALLATSTLGGSYLGAKIGSRAGNTLDQRVDKSTIWAMVGGVTGGLAGFAFGPSGTFIGKVLGASVGAALGAWAGHHFAGKADRDYNPRTFGALLGGVNGALIGGPVGAAVGVPLGYIGGDFLDRNVFSNRTYDVDRWRYGRRYDDEDGNWDFDNRHGYYPPGSGRGRSGVDREGFDRLGYNRDGYDREGYDRFGYDKDGLDRRGFDKKGFRKVERGQDHYDPGVYNDYWQTWGRLGGEYPKFGKDHFQFFPPPVQKVSWDRYAQRAPSAIPSADLITLKMEYKKAVDALQRLGAAGTQAARQEALERLRELEAQLQQKYREETGK